MLDLPLRTNILPFVGQEREVDGFFSMLLISWIDFHISHAAIRIAIEKLMALVDQWNVSVS